MQVHIDTLKLVDGFLGTIDVTINGKTETVQCWNKDARERGRGWYINVNGIACKIGRGVKVWPASVLFNAETGKITNLLPRNYQAYNRHLHCTLVGFESDHQDKANRSLHNGGYRK
jgi:hypothetical protein